MKTCVYGLSDAPSSWYVRVRDEFEKLKVKTSIYDHALFFWHEDGILQGIIASHVDDFIFGGSKVFISEVINPLKEIFCISHEEAIMFKYTGLHIKQCLSEIQVDQRGYVESIKPIALGKKRSTQKYDDLNHDEREEFRTICGQLNWVSRNTRPETSYDTCLLSNAMKTCKAEDILAGNKVIKRLKSEDLALRFPNLGSIMDSKLIAYSDASYANLPDGSSQGAFVVLLVNSEGLFAPLAWQSKKLKRVVKSTLAAETLAAVEAVETGFLLTLILKEQHNSQSSIDIECFTDNQSLFDTIHSTNSIIDKRLRVDMAILREMVHKKEVLIKWVETKDQLADALTKKGASSTRLMEALRSSHLGTN